MNGPDCVWLQDCESESTIALQVSRVVSMLDFAFSYMINLKCIEFHHCEYCDVDY